MKDLTGYLKKTLCKYSFLGYSFLLILILFFFFSLRFQHTTAASQLEDFKIFSTFEHTLASEDVTTDAILQIRSDRPRVITYYNATIPIEDLRVECVNLNTNQLLECTPSYRGSTTDVMINLDNFVIRPDEPLEVKLTYTTPIIAKSYNLTSEIYDTVTNSVLIRYPKELGEPLWTSDPIHNVRSVAENFEVLISKPTNPKISLLFGQRLLYRFEINKVFSNTLNEENQTFELYVPSDTPTQTIIWEEISPLPDTALKDEDGNYIFKYVVSENETVDCKITGFIQKMESDEDEKESQLFLTETRGYWSITNRTEYRRVNNFLKRRGLNVLDNFEDVETLEDNEKELFYRYLYQYVIDRLNHEEDIPLGIGAEIRLGANTLTESSNGVGSIDYADFLIALLRGYNVPSRLVVGYVSNITGYTSDGFYHHWVEYFDSSQNRWVTADPFLEDYLDKNLFGSSFLDHITILRRGKSPVAPKITFFQETDFIVNAEANDEIYPEFSIESELEFKSFKNTDPFVKAFIHITNSGNLTMSGYDILKSNIENLQRFADPVNNLQSQIILPEQKANVQYNIPYDDIDSRNIFVNIQFENFNRFNSEETLESNVEEITPLYLSIFSKIISILVFCVVIFLIYFSVKRGKNILHKRKKQ